jgi:HEAT repeat protein
MHAVGDKDDGIRAAAAASLPWVCVGAGQDQAGIAALASLLSDENITVRGAAARGIGWIARKTKEPSGLVMTIPLLKKMVRGEKKDIAWEAEWALDEIKKRRIDKVDDEEGT